MPNLAELAAAGGNRCGGVGLLRGSLTSQKVPDGTFGSPECVIIAAMPVDMLKSERSVDLTKLQEACAGAVVVSGEAAYDPYRQGWNLTLDHTPSVIVVAETVADVQSAVRFANEHDLPIAVHNTGHGSLRNVEGAVLIHVGALTAVSVDESTGLARIGGGAKWCDVAGPAFEAGYAIPCGSSPNVGVVGYTLGGGYGLFVRKYGLAIDHLVSAQVVTPDGDLVTASATENPELFWAIRGGGGSFGVIVEIDLQLPQEPTVFGGAVMFPAERRYEVLRAYHAWVQNLDESVSSAFFVIAFPPAPFIPEPLRGRAFACLAACVVGDTAEELLAPVRSLDGVFLDYFRTMPITESGDIFRDPVDPMPGHGTGVLLSDLPESKLEAFLDAIGDPQTSPTLKVEIRHIGGAMARSEYGDSAVGDRRTANYIAFALGIPMPGIGLDTIRSHAEGVFASLGDSVICPGPLNWLGEVCTPAERIRETFGAESYDRLKQIKAEIDPANRFRFAGVGIPLAELGN